jgi:hypothetical protein
MILVPELLMIGSEKNHSLADGRVLAIENLGVYGESS